MLVYISRFLLYVLFCFCCLAGFAQTKKNGFKKKAPTKELSDAPADDSTFYKAFYSGEVLGQHIPAINHAPLIKNFPKRKPSLLKSLPNLTSEADVVAYVKQLHGLLSAKTTASKMADVKKVLSSVNNDASKLSNAAVAAWQYGANYEALLLAMESCLKNPKDAMALNNLSALLNLAGGESKSLPLLRKIVAEYPKSSMVLNNLGQAYTGIGELDTAMVYFARCLEQAPDHPEANNTAGQIEASRGHTQKAERYFEKASQGVITQATLNEMEHNPTANWIQMRPKVRIPYFNPYASKYQLRKQIESVGESIALGAEHSAFESFLANTQDVYINLSNGEGEQARAGEERKAMAVATSLQRGTGNLNLSIPPFAAQASRKMVVLMNSYANREALLYKYAEEREREIEQLRDEFNKKLQAIAKSCKTQQCVCSKSDEAANVYLKAAAPIRRDIQLKQLLLAREKYENMAYYGYLSGADRHDARRKFYDACVNYLQAVMEANKTENQAPCDDFTNPEMEEMALDAPIEPFCPIQLKIDIKVGELELTCDKFKISAFGGVLKGSQDPDTRQYTLALGVELKKEITEVDLGVIKGAVEIAAEETFYLTFDENNRLVDAGLAVEVELSAEAGITGSKGKQEERGAIGRAETAEEMSEAIKGAVRGESGVAHAGGVDQITKWETGFGYTLGVNSGWTFNEGALGTLSKVLQGELAPTGPLKQFHSKK